MKTNRKIMGLALSCVALLMTESVYAAAITQREAAQAIINYEAYSKAKENVATAQEKYAPPPLLAVGVKRASDASAALPLVSQNNADIMTRLVHSAIQGKTANTLIANTIGNPDGYDLTLHYSLFCLPWEIAAISTCPVSTSYGGVDIDASHLLGAVRIDSTDSAKLVGVDALINNITQFNLAPMVVLKSPKASIGDYPIPKLQDLKKRINQVAQGSVAMNSFSNMLAMRMPQRFSSLVDGTSSSTNLEKSLMEVLQNESTRRFADPLWTTQLLQTPDSALLRELASMESFRLYMDYMRYQQMERIEALLATLLSTQLSVIRDTSPSGTITPDATPTGGTGAGAGGSSNTMPPSGIPSDLFRN